MSPHCLSTQFNTRKLCLARLNPARKLSHNAEAATIAQTKQANFEAYKLN